MTEYALLAALIAVLSIGAIALLSGSVEDMFVGANSGISK